MSTDSENLFARLTWDDLTDWAGYRAVVAGNDYKRDRAVQDLRTTSAGGVVGWVRDRERVATRVDVANGVLAARCTCESLTVCRHAIAVVLERLERLKKGAPVPSIDDGDIRLLLLARRPLPIGDSEILSRQDLADPSGASGRASASMSDPHDLSLSGSSELEGLHPYLASLSREELEALLERALSLEPAVVAIVEDQMDLDRGNTSRLLAAIRAQLAQLVQPVRFSSAPVVETIDWASLRRRLGALVDAGFVDDALELGQELVDAGMQAVEWYEQDGEIGFEIAETLRIIVTGLPASSLSPTEQVQWIEAIAARDEYGICTTALEPFWTLERSEEQWQALASEIQLQLSRGDEQTPAPPLPSYERDLAVDRLTYALGRANRSDEILPVYEREARATGSYERLVEYLVRCERWEEAERWCREGIDVMGSKPGLGAGRFLRYTLRTICETRGNLEMAAALRAEEFFVDPCTETFQSFVQAAEAFGLGAEAETYATDYLTTGRLPSVSEPGWPFVDPGLPSEANDRQSEAPLYSVLVSVAIALERPDDVVDWLDRAREANRTTEYLPLDQAADAIKKRHPKRAVAIWKQSAEFEIARGTPDGYEATSNLLRSIRDTLRSGGSDDEWHALIADLRSRFSRKKRFVEHLDKLSGRPIVETL